VTSPMSNPAKLLSEFETIGVQLWIEEDQLRFRAPLGVMTEDRRELLRTHKSDLVSYLRAADGPALLRPDAGARFEPFPLTAVQGAYLLGRSEAFEYGGVSAHMYLEIVYPELDPDRLETAWHALVCRHDALRTVVHVDGYQRALPEVPRYKIEVNDLRGKAPSEVAAGVEATRDRLSHRNSPSDAWPLFTLELTRSDDAVRLHFSIDLLIADSASIQLLLYELRQVYLQPTVRALPLGIAPRDYVLAQLASRDTPQFSSDRAYWWQKIDDLPDAPQLPLASDVRASTDEAPASVRFKRMEFRLSESQWRALQAHAAAADVTVSCALMTAYAEVIARWSKQRRFVLNLPVFNRAPVHEEVEQLIGDFTSVTLLAVDLTQDDTFAERAKAIGATLFEDLDHGRCSGIEVLNELARRKGRAAASMPVTYTSILGSQARGDVGGEIVFGLSQTPQVWLDCQVLEHRGGLLVAWDVREGVFPEGMAEDAFCAFEALARRLIENEAVWQLKAPVELPPAQQARRNAVNDTSGPAPNELLHAAVLEQAVRTPDAPALIAARRTLSYRELIRRADAVADALRSSGCGQGDIVAVCMNKGIEQVVAVIGVLMAGAAYLPIDTNQPPARRSQILLDARVSMALTQSWLWESGVAADAPPEVRWAFVDAISPEEPKGRLTPSSSSPAKPDDLAYVIYTSGSTGTPKGVMISHRSAVNTIADINRRFDIRDSDRVLHLVNLGFDLSVYDIFGTLAAGGALVVPEPERRGDPSHWAELVAQHGVTVWNSVPAQLQMLDDYLSASSSQLPTLRLALVSGDWVPVSLPGRIRSRVPGLCVTSLGGATEASIWSIIYPIIDCDPGWRSVPYGKPLANQRFHVLDAALAPCPDWVTGELYIAGRGLAIGYLHDAAKTAERFIVHPETGERLYRTGDLGRYHPDGNIEFLGREDSQVKIRGHRIELAEIEAALATHPGVASAVVLIEGERSDRRLVAFCQAAPADPIQHPSAEIPISHAAGAGAQATADLDRGKFAALMRSADEVVVLEMAQHLKSAGLFAAQDMTHNEEEIAEALHVAPVHRRLLRRWLKALCASGALQVSPATARYGHLKVDGARPVSDVWRELEGLERQVGYGEKTLAYVRTCSSHLGELFRGELDVRTLLFPEDEVGSARVETAWAAYRDNLVSRSLNQTLIGGIRALANQTREEVTDDVAQERLRILEVGAGVGGTSTELIPALAREGVDVDYLFSDISPFFLNEARTRFGSYPWVRYGLFDINVPPVQQGILPNSADIIICANVLHNARDIRVVLRRLKQTLVPGGWLVFIEPTRTHNYPLLVSMEFFPELGSFSDLREGTDQTFFTRDQWLTQLREAGALPVACLPDADDTLSLGGQNVFFARFKAERARVTSRQLLDHVASRLPEYMVPSRLHLVDYFPHTANAKLDRAALTALVPGGSARSDGIGPHTGEAPEDELEQRIAALWGELLGREFIGRDEDFYALGGDSLLISRLVGKLREREPTAAGLEWEVILRQMLRAPTVAGLAAYLRSVDRNRPGRDGDSDEVRSESALVPLHGTELDPVQVLVHAGTGTLLPYQSLLTEMRRRCSTGSIVGLEVPERSKYLDLAPEALVKRLGGDYAKLLLERGHRRFHVVGYCLGGLIATEVAQALKEAGGSILSLTIISSLRPPFRVDDELMVEYMFALSMGADPVGLGFPDDQVAFGRAIRTILAQTPDRMADGCFAALSGEHSAIGDRFRTLAQRTQAERLAAFHEALPSTQQLKGRGIAAYDGGASYTLEQIVRLFAVFRQSVFAVSRFQPEPYAGDITLMRHSGSYNLMPGMRADIASYWRRVCLGELRVVDISGDHFSCLGSPHAVQVQRKLSELHEAAE